jgi:YggT family protein
MGSSYVTNPLEFLISTLFGLYILIVLLRVIFQVVRADFYNPISQFIVKVTNPLVIPLRRVIPAVGGLDTAVIVLLVLLQMVSLGVIVSLEGLDIGFLSLFVWSVAELISLLINVFVFSVFIIVIVSWINPGTYNPAIGLVASITEPLLAPARRMLPPISGIDLSPLAVLIGLQLLKMLVIPPIMSLVQT